MSEHLMPPESALALLAALGAEDVAACVGGGWGVDALLGEQTREHEDLDLWVEAEQTDRLFTALVKQGVDRLHLWPGDRPWNFCLHDGSTRRVDLHLYEALPDGRLHYGSVTSPFYFSVGDLAGEGRIAGTAVRCERPEFSLANHTGYPARDVDRHDVALLCARFGFASPLDD